LATVSLTVVPAAIAPALACSPTDTATGAAAGAASVTDVAAGTGALVATLNGANVASGTGEGALAIGGTLPPLLQAASPSAISAPDTAKTRPCREIRFKSYTP
jgi:hypothetical protein